MDNGSSSCIGEDFLLWLIACVDSADACKYGSRRVRGSQTLRELGLSSTKYPINFNISTIRSSEHDRPLAHHAWIHVEII